jgi:hypothetical protein
MTEDLMSNSTNVIKAIYLIFRHGQTLSGSIVNFEFLTAQRFR